MGRRRIGEVWGGVGDVTPQYEQRGGLGDHGAAQRGLERIEVLGHLAHGLDVPAVGGEATGGVVGEPQIRAAVDGDAVVVIDVDEAAQTQMTRHGGRLVAHALGEIAVAADHEGVVVAEFGAIAGAQPALGQSHPHGVGEALTQRTGGDLHADGGLGLGVSGSAAAPLAEGLQVLQGEGVAAEVGHAVQEDRGVAGAQHEAVPVGPVGRSRVEGHDPAPQHVRQRGQGHGGALVAGTGSMRRIHGESADHLDGALVESGIAGHSGAGVVLQETAEAHGAAPCPNNAIEAVNPCR